MADATKARDQREALRSSGRSEIEIAAAPEVAWDVLTAIGRWPSWNPAVKSVSFEEGIEEGSEFRWKAGPGTIRSDDPGRRAAAPDRLDGHVVRSQGDPRAHVRAAGTAGRW